jgi:hypothetical protein
MPFKKKNEELDQYLDASNEIAQEEAVDEIQQDDDQSSDKIQNIKSSRLKKLHFWSDWPRKKKIIFFSSLAAAITLFLFIIFAFIIRPSRTNGYIKNSWYDLVSSSSSIERAVKSEVNLEGTRDLADSLYSYNEKLSTITYQSNSKSNITYTSKVKDFAEITDEMSSYYSESATLLSKAGSDFNLSLDGDLDQNSDSSTLENSKIEDLKTKGENLRNKINEFRNKSNLEQELSPDLLSLDVYIANVVLKKQEIENEKKEEEEKKKQEELAVAQKEAKDKSSVESLTSSYYSAFINGNETGVKSTLSKGFQTEYDYASLKPERRASFYPKSFRVISVEKDSANYKVTSTVTYISIYEDTEGNSIENSQPVTEIYRAVFSPETGSWKIDGRIES